MTQLLSEVGGRVLLMADSGSSLVRYSEHLSASAWRVLPAADEHEALVAVQTAQVDLAVLEVVLPEARAGALPAALRQAAGSRYLPVVVIAPGSTEQSRCRLLDGGADDIVPGDISPAELSARLRALMRVKLLQDQLRESREALAASLARERTLLTQLRTDNEHLTALAETDALTGLQNVRHLEGFLDNQFKIARRYNRPLSALAMDLDHFKRVNDTYGHPTGDYVLKELAAVLKAQVRDSDVVARTGGEEFSVVLPNSGRAQAWGLAQRIREQVEGRVFAVFGRQFGVTISIGAACYPEDVEIAGPQMLLYLADQALLLAKQGGRNRVQAFGQLPAVRRRELREQFLAPAAPAEIALCDVRR